MEFGVIQDLSKPSSLFQRLDWCTCHSQGQDVQWKFP